VSEDEALDGLQNPFLSWGEFFPDYVHHFVHHIYNSPPNSVCQEEFTKKISARREKIPVRASTY
jgi:hypothetical protein